MNQETTSGEAGRGLGAAPCSAVESAKPKFKVDWFTPFVPAMLMICGVRRLSMKGKSDAEFITNMILGALMIYVAFFNLHNVGRRKMRSDPPNDPDQRPGKSPKPL